MLGLALHPDTVLLSEPAPECRTQATALGVAQHKLGKQNVLGCQTCARLELDCCGALRRRPCKNGPLHSLGISAGEGTKVT
jgi:hypothetical protein